MTTVGRYQGAMMTITKTRGPLRFKKRTGEITFAPGSVKTVQIRETSRRNLRTPNGRPYVETWYTEVNGREVYNGTEKGARQQYERALKYLR